MSDDENLEFAGRKDDHENPKVTFAGQASKICED